MGDGTIKSAYGGVSRSGLKNKRKKKMRLQREAAVRLKKQRESASNRHVYEDYDAD
jgi:hypothetical protein